VLPGHPGSERRSLTFPPASPASKSYSSCESVRANLSCPKPTADPLLSFRLSRAFSYHAQSPRPARATRARTCLLPRRFGNTTQRTLTPSEPGEPTSNTSASGRLVDSFRSPSRPACTTSRRRPYSLGLGTRSRNPSPLTFEVFRYVESGVSPKRSPSLLRFHNLVIDHTTMKPSQVRASSYPFASRPSSRHRSPRACL